jgi:Glutathione synthase/Ribosomal protein S6 modification enzyme (glutaminyl transferase)
LKKIIALTDYNGQFGTKRGAVPYRSGFNKAQLAAEFKSNGYNLEYLPIANVFSRGGSIVEDAPVIYTSSEDHGLLYKSYIEDVVLGLEICGVKVFPGYRFLRAHENKVFMEILRTSYKNSILNAPITDIYGVHEDLLSKQDEYSEYPTVLKRAHGSMSRGVDIARNRNELLRKAMRISSSPSFFADLKDKIRPWIHKGYKKVSARRNKFLIQKFIPNLDSDWKVLVFGSRFYVFRRPVRAGDFRASGSGHKNYLYGDQVVVPEGMLNFASSIYKALNVPHVSLDIAYDEKEFFLIEMQFLYFGTVGQEKANCFYESIDGEWKKNYTKLSVERVYAESMARYIDKFTG